MDKIEKIMSLIESVEYEVAEAAILAGDGYTDEAKEAYAKAVSIKEQIKCMLCELVQLSKKQLDRTAISCQNRGMKYKGENYVEEN